MNFWWWPDLRNKKMNFFDDYQICKIKMNFWLWPDLRHKKWTFDVDQICEMKKMHFRCWPDLRNEKNTLSMLTRFATWKKWKKTKNEQINCYFFHFCSLFSFWKFIFLEAKLKIHIFHVVNLVNVESSFFHFGLAFCCDILLSVARRPHPKTQVRLISIY